MAATASTKTNLDEQLAWLAQNQSATLRPPAGVPPPAHDEVVPADMSRTCPGRVPDAGVAAAAL